MKLVKSLRMTAVWMACAGMLTPAAIFGSTPAEPTTPLRISDVALAAGNTLTGQLVDSQGQPLAQQAVYLQRNGQVVAKVVTNEVGQFQAGQLQGGLYHVATSTTQGTYRVWADQTAPPAAATGVLLVDNGQVLRGQCADGCSTAGVPGHVLGQGGFPVAPGGGGMLGFLANPWVIGAAVAAAIAIPLAVDDDDAS